MIIDVPDEYTVSEKDFDTMTVELARLLMLFCSRSRFKIIFQSDPDTGNVTVKREASD